VRDHSASSRSSVVWQAAHTHVRRSVTRWGSRRSVHGIIRFAPQRGHGSVCWPGWTSDGSQGIFGFMVRIILNPDTFVAGRARMRA
jgi:hypothetical protein